jgi:glycosyltransferase involved in cell wall biosynthesis
VADLLRWRAWGEFVTGLDYSNDSAEICVIGRVQFDTEIGARTFAFCEMLARSFPVCVLPTDPGARDGQSVVLPSGRPIPICHDMSAMKATIYCDVLWTGQQDDALSLVPRHTLNYAFVVFDSDELPTRWANELNERFDLAIVPSAHLVTTLRKSGVERPIACVPLALPLEPSLARPFQPARPGRVRFCSIEAFHPRKGARLLVESFAQRFRDRHDIELRLHSDIPVGSDFEDIQQFIRDLRLPNVTATIGPLSAAEKDDLVRNCDVLVSASRSEGYAIGPRQALALGKSLVLSDVGGHADLSGLPGVFLVPATQRVPARYPEIDNLIFGHQRVPGREALGECLEQAAAYIHADAYTSTAHERRMRSADFSFERLASCYAELINPDLSRFRGARNWPRDVTISLECRARVRQALGPAARTLRGIRKTVTPAYDGGFFSVFNAFMTHLVWDRQEARCHGVFPDWDIGRLIQRSGTDRFVSFCYGRPTDGNIWTKLFEPLYGCSEADMNDVTFLYENACIAQDRHNERREPLMTWIHAYKLYKTRDFASWRRQYHWVFRDQVRLRPEKADEIDAFCAENLRAGFLIAAHVRHPSHVMEQLTGSIAQDRAYIDRIRQWLRHRGVDAANGDWKLFLATDQERVVERFRREFGDHLVCFTDVRRTRPVEDSRYESLSEAERKQEGHQVQHLVAADPRNWNIRMAWEVVRDAYVMARCHTLLHVVSNISTAVSYMNPDIELEFCQP